MRTGRLALAGLRGHARRLGATALAIMLSVAFVATTLLVLDAMERGVAESVAGDLVNRDLVVQQVDGTPTGVEVDALRKAPGIEVVDASAQIYSNALDGSLILATTAPRGPGVALLEGTLPQGADEAVVSSTSDLTVGDTVSFQPYGSGAAAPDARLELDVVGIMELGNNPEFSWSDVLVVDEHALRGWDPDLLYSAVTVDLAGASESTARATIEDVIPGASVRTGPEAAAQAIELATGGLDFIGPILLGFGAIAVATSALVIANTFAIVLTQRTRELALLRCVGATRSQVRRTVLLEAGALGVVASTLGVLLAVVFTWGAAALLGEINLGTPITLRPGWDMASLLVPWLVGIAVTLGAAWAPIRRATRVAPMAALQPASAPVVASRPGLLRVVASVLLVGAGAAGLVLAATTHDVMIGVAAGLVSFVGVLVAAVFFVPAGIRALGYAMRGVPSRLAVGNTVADPARAAATSAALLIGVTLITMTSVGAASAARTAGQEIDAQFPADVIVSPNFQPPSDSDGYAEYLTAEPLPTTVRDQVAALPAVAQSAPVEAGWLDVVAVDKPWSRQAPVYGVDPASVAPVLRDPESVQVLVPGTVGLSKDVMREGGLSEGDRVELTGPDGSLEASVVRLGFGEIVLPREDLLALDAGATEAGLLVRLTEDADVGAVVSDIRTAVGPDGWVDGGAPARAQLTMVLDVMVLVTTALLGVAVLIAVVGIANTLALSVLERTRENALLRALGLTRSQLRGMLTIEGVLLALVSALVGIGLGVAYAWFGVQTLMPAGTDTALAFPVTRLAIILVIAIVAGLLASVLPARRAARIAPAAGLAAV